VSKDKPNYKKVAVKDLRLGMFVADVGRGWLRHPWPTRSKVISSKADIDRLVEFGITHVIVDLEHGKKTPETPPRPAPAPPRPKPAAPPPPAGETAEIVGLERRTGVRPEKNLEPTTMEEELPRVREAYSHALQSIKDVMARIEEGGKIDIEAVRETVEDVIDSIFRNRDAFLALLKIRVYDKYDFAHPLNVSVLSVALGRNAGMTAEELRELGLGAILHDVGKIHISRKILDKPGRLTPEEFEIIKQHPINGVRMLKGYQEISPAALGIVLGHHERIDGSGYPKGISGNQVHPYNIICGMADVFDAVSTERVYRKGFQPFAALRVLFQMRDKQFSAKWLDRFVYTLGIYPPGTVVRLDTGEVAVVVALNHGQLLRPMVRLVEDGQGRPLVRTRPVDLNQEGMSARNIVGVVDEKELREKGLQPSRYVDPHGEE